MNFRISLKILARKNQCVSLIVALFFSIELFSLLSISVTLAEAKTNVHIVYFGANKHADPDTTKKSHHKFLSNFLGSKEAAKRSLLYSYRHGFSGFAAKLTESEALSIAELPEVVQVIPNHIYKLHTTRSWDFIGINHRSPNNPLTKSMGRGTIIGVIDSGIWPESESFNGEGMAEAPARWRGVCQTGELFNTTNCNNKIIGARWFAKAFLAEKNNNNNNNNSKTTTKNNDFMSPRDGNGHGTHTASTAAGRLVEQASFNGLGTGLARGGAPMAHLAIYKACWGSGGCANADILKAFDKAVLDGVDVLSVSVGIRVPLFAYADNRDAISVGSFHAVLAGIVVVSSAGNYGPASQTVSNTAPWLLTVGASTIDRSFPTRILLGNNKTLWGQSFDTRRDEHLVSAEITYSERIALESSDLSPEYCEAGSLNVTLATGKIVMCFSSSEYQQNMFLASKAVKEAGGVGLIFAQSRSDGLQSCHIPCVKVDYEVGTQILSYIRRARTPTAKLSYTRTVIGKSMSPRVATFSSRGPSSLTPTILKPDIVGPGVDILAAYLGGRKERKKEKKYIFLSGTSMACPHVAAIASLIKSLHPNWSPAAIRSALVTTASQIGNDGSHISAEGPTRNPASPFDMGGGHVNPNKALEPGLIYNLTTHDYIQFICSLGYKPTHIARLTISQTTCAHKTHDLNLPSITIPNLRTTSSVTVTRTVTNVGDLDSVYTVAVKQPTSVNVRVDPPILRFDAITRVLSFNVTFCSSQRVHGDYKFGSLTWRDAIRKYRVRTPLIVRVIRFESYADV